MDTRSFIDKTNRHLRDFLGFEEHMRQIRKQRGDSVPDAWYRFPYYYELLLGKDKMRHSGELLRFPSYVQKKDYEFEIVGMFLKPIKTTDKKEAIAHIRDHMVFCIFNDASCRDFQARDMLLPLGVSNSKGIADKSFGPLCLQGGDIPMDENGVFNIPMSLHVNDELRAYTNFNTIYFTHPKTGELKNWSFAEAVVFMGYMNQGFEEGSLIGSGTVGNGSIAEHTDRYPWLTDGDRICMHAKGLGDLANVVEIVPMVDPMEIYKE